MVHSNPPPGVQSFALFVKFFSFFPHVSFRSNPLLVFFSPFLRDHFWKQSSPCFACLTPTLFHCVDFFLVIFFRSTSSRPFLTVRLPHDQSECGQTSLLLSLSPFPPQPGEIFSEAEYIGYDIPCVVLDGLIIGIIARVLPSINHIIVMSQPSTQFRGPPISNPFAIVGFVFLVTVHVVWPLLGLPLARLSSPRPSRSLDRQLRRTPILS